jgi:hypothetical protein
MSLATITNAYDRKTRSKDTGGKMQPVLKTMVSPSKESLRGTKDLKKDPVTAAAPSGWEFFLNPLEYE